MLIKDATAKNVAAAVSDMGAAHHELCILFLAGPQAKSLSPFINELRGTGVPFVGAVVPGLIHGGSLHPEGALLLKMPCVEKPLVVTGLNQNHFEFPPLAAHLAESGLDEGTALILVDGLTRNICTFLAELSGLFGNTVQYIGGGAGFPDFRRRPCLFTADGPLQDAALTVFIPMKSSLGVRHGYTRMLSPLVATKTHGSTIGELNWRNALEVYGELIGQTCRMKVTRENFQGASQLYPFGIMKEGEEDIVREAYAVTPNGEMMCVGDIPENTILSVLHGGKDDLIEAAADAARNCVAGKNEDPKSCLVIDCVSRSLFLATRYEEELAGIQNAMADKGCGLQPEGFLSVGEIASHGEGTVDFLNKTTVIGAFYE